MTDSISGLRNPEFVASTAEPTGLSDANQSLSGNEFITLLVAQLKNQDPLEPKDNSEFAVDLAQFTQVEKLDKIIAALDGGGGDSLGSLASYLGNEVWLNTDVASVKDGNGGEVAFNLGVDATDVKVELVDESGTVVATVEAGAQSSGSKRVALDDLGSLSGDYQARVVATTATGEQINPEVSVAGIVSGFVPGANPALFVGEREVSTADIKRVNIPA